ncbi:alpha-glucosidase [Marinobacteraceae bacterium S3BR75-40.1]
MMRRYTSPHWPWLLTGILTLHPLTSEAALMQQVTNTSLTTGDFRITLADGSLSVTQRGRTLWQSVPDAAFVMGAVQDLQAEENRGSFLVEENLAPLCNQQTIDSIEQQNGAVSVSGHLGGGNGCDTHYLLRFQQVREGHLQFQLVFDNPAVNYSELVYASSESERFYGFGEQFSYLNLKGQAVPILSQEGGVGRGHTPITQAVNLGSEGSGGNALTTYYAVPQYITNTNKSLFLENTDYTVFDLTAPEQVRVRLFNGHMRGRILAGDSMLELITRFTDYTGRMRPLPDWFQQGAIVGMQGGTAKVQNVLDELERRGTPVAGVWLQDWVGKRQTSLGSQLWWNWELDRDRYPNWNQLADRVESRGGHMLCYINPFLVDASEKGNLRRNLYQEAAQQGFLVKDDQGQVIKVTNTDFDAGMVDLTNPGAVQWIKAVIQQQLVGEGRCRGWMHDFAEALPFEARMYDGRSGEEYHNQYSVDWARIGREAIEEAGLGDDIVFFNRSGAARTPQYSTLLWGGDQLVTWDKYDGFKTAILANMTGGFSGISLNHADIGGYTNASFSGIGYNREEELLLRWMEYAAFTPAFRTHEGLKPEDNAQFYDNDRTYRQFDRFARVYKALGFYRKQLMREATEKGWPLVRHPMLHYPNDDELATLKDHFMLGSEILVAPIVNKEAYSNGWKKVYFPDAGNTTWIHLWSGKRYGKNGNASGPWWSWLNPARGNWEWVPAPMGEPPVFYRAGSSVGEELVRRLDALGVQR